jgi:hypothetical protein
MDENAQTPASAAAITTVMKPALHELVLELRQLSPAKLAGAVKTYPYTRLMALNDRLHQQLARSETSSTQAREFQRTMTLIQQGLAKRAEAARHLVEKFAATTAEVIALNNSVFTLVPSRDLLEDMKTAHTDATQIEALKQASGHILEAVNIDIQQRFYNLAPETIAIHYSGQELDAYRRLLRNLLAQLDINAPIFKIYTTIIRNVMEGIRVYQTSVSIARGLCREIFQTDPPAYDLILGQYTTDDLESQARLLRATLDILERDITRRPSILEFAEQCRLLIKCIPGHLADRKLRMRKTSRILQLAHYIEYKEPEKISENATTSLLFCHILFEEAQRFLLTQQTHLDVALNIRSLEDASHKVEHGLHYRQYALGQLFKELSQLSVDDLALVPEQRLGDSNLLLQEVLNLVEEYIERKLPALPAQKIMGLVSGLQRTIQKLHDAIVNSKGVPDGVPSFRFLDIQNELPNLTEYYDEELISLIRKALKPERTPSEIDQSASVEQALEIPLERLQHYIDGFLRAIR